MLVKLSEIKWSKDRCWETKRWIPFKPKITEYEYEIDDDDDAINIDKINKMRMHPNAHDEASNIEFRLKDAVIQTLVIAERKKGFLIKRCEIEFTAMGKVLRTGIE